MSAPKPPKVEMIDLKVRYGSKVALKGLTLSVAEHSIIGIIGPAGSGKTSMLRVLNRTVELTPGVRVTGSVKKSEIRTVDRKQDSAEFVRTL